jgi:hypothetical protein
MGLFIIRARFRAQTPSEEVFRSAVHAWLGSTDAIDSVQISGAVLSVTFSMDAVVHAYISKAIVELEGECVDGSGNVVAAKLPSFVERPWPRWSIWHRLYFRLRKGP